MFFSGWRFLAIFQSWMWSIMWFSLESGWRRRPQSKEVSMHERVFVCHLALWINACCFPSGVHRLWSSHTQGRERGPEDVTVAGLCVLVGVSVYIFLFTRRHTQIFWVGRSPSVHACVFSVRFRCVCCVFDCLFSLLCVWRAHKQDDAAGRKLWSHQECQQGQFFIR